MEQAKALDLVEPLDWDAIGPEPMFEEAKGEYGYGYQYYSTIMAWREDAKAPQSWQDFWDVANFPGKQALPDYPTYILPMALLADGVPVAELYPLDLDRAFASLEKIKDQVAVWWQAGARRRSSSRTTRCSTRSRGRAGSPARKGIDYTSKTASSIAFFVGPRAPTNQKALANGIFYEMSVPENQAVAADVVSYTGNSPDSSRSCPRTASTSSPPLRQTRRCSSSRTPSGGSRTPRRSRRAGRSSS